jgi:hypothetical protein
MYGPLQYKVSVHNVWKCSAYLKKLRHHHKEQLISVALDMIAVHFEYDMKRIHTLWQNAEFIISDTEKYTHILLNHHFISTVRNCNMFQPLTF